MSNATNGHGGLTKGYPAYRFGDSKPTCPREVVEPDGDVRCAGPQGSGVTEATGVLRIGGARAHDVHHREQPSSQARGFPLISPLKKIKTPDSETPFSKPFFGII